MKKLRNVLISLFMIGAILTPMRMSAMQIEDLLICPGLQAIFDKIYVWEDVA